MLGKREEKKQAVLLQKVTSGLLFSKAEPQTQTEESIYGVCWFVGLTAISILTQVNKKPNRPWADVVVSKDLLVSLNIEEINKAIDKNIQVS